MMKLMKSSLEIDDVFIDDLIIIFYEIEVG